MPHQPPPSADTIPLFTPTNLLLLSLTIYIAYLRLRPRRLPVLPATPAPLVYRKYTPRTLRPHNGRDLPTVYLAVSGKVYDVTSGKSFYGPGGPYENFAGRDASRGLAKGSFELEVVEGAGDKEDGKLDQLEDLTEEERGALREWEGHFGNKYLLVGELVKEGQGDEDGEGSGSGSVGKE